MANNNFRDAIISFIHENAKPVDKFSHQPRLYALTRLIGAGEACDDDVVFAAVWLHDLGVFVGHRPEDPDALARWDCVAYAVQQAPRILADLGFPKEKIPAAVEAIRTHQSNAEPASIEAAIVRDADILEQLGATAVLRTTCKIGRDTRFKTFPDALRALRQQLESLPAQLRLVRSRELAVPRVEILRQFLEAAEAEGAAAERGVHAA
ncbi:MAG TPA: HD domain-containing protein [Verrucomicrobiae bacterium]|nr:HD domain-containing protein [Verrucomicrobiae bacterium]